MSSFKLIATEDVKLNVNKYLIEDMKGIVICVHGMCEHSRRYAELAAYLNNSGYSVYTYDHRGHGESLLSDEKPGYLGIDGFNNMVRDLNILVSYVKEKHPDKYVFLLGHSMGSFITTRYVELYDKVSGVILSGSNYGTNPLTLAIFLSNITCLIKGDKSQGKLLEKLSFGNYNKQFDGRTAFDWLNRDEKEVDKYINDEMCGFTCSNRFYNDFFRGLKKVEKNISSISKNLPILIISGMKDPVGGNGRGANNLYNKLKETGHKVDMKLYEEARHEILLELNKQEVFNDIYNWLETIDK